MPRVQKWRAFALAGTLFFDLNAARADSVPMPDKPPELVLEAVKNTYGLLRGNFTIVNPNDAPIKDVVLNCDVEGQSGTAIVGRKFVVYQIIPGRSRRSMKDFDFGIAPSQTASFACKASLR